MRKSAALVLLVLVASCGGSEEKAAFERYERSVELSLKADAELRVRFEEKIEDLGSYLDETGFDTLILTRMAPHYAELAKRFDAVRPPEGKLAELHAVLLRYVAEWREFCSLWGEVVAKKGALAKVGEGLVPKVDAAKDEWLKAGKALNAAVGAARAASGKLAPLFEQENQVAEVVMKLVPAMQRGIQRASTVVALADRELAPHYGQFEAAGDSPGLPPEVRLALKAYAASGAAVVAAIREFAAERVAPETEVERLKQRAGDLRNTCEETIAGYRAAAKAYRDSLR